MRAWIVRGLLAGLLLFASEILLWTDPAGRAPLDWALLIAGYLALAALLLDFAARYRVRDAFSLLILAGVYGLLNSLILNPQTALADVPLTWATRVMGAHTLAGLGALALFLALTAGRGRWLWPAAALTGLLWGVWARWLSSFTEIGSSSPPILVMLALAEIPLLGIVVLARLAAGQPDHLSALRLRFVDWLPVIGVLAALFVVHRAQVPALSLVVLGLLAAYGWLLLWFEKRDQGATLLDSSVPPRPVGLITLLVAALIFQAAGIAGYSLPFTAANAPVEPLIGLFAAFGLVWLPTVSLVLGVRSYRRLGRQQRL